MKNIFTILILLVFLSGCSNERESFYLFKAGKAKTRLHDYHGAIQDYTKAIELNPENAEAYHNRGKAKIFLRDDHKTKMNQMVRNASDYSKKDLIELMEVIQIEIDEAIQDYSKAIELNPENAETYYNRGKAKIFLIDYLNTKMYLMVRKASNYDKKDSIEIKKVILVETNEAIKDYTKAIELDPKYAISYNNRGNAKGLLRDYDEAIQDYTRAIELNPENVATYNNRGRAKIFLIDYHGAIQDYDKAIELDPKYAISYNNRGNAKRLLGDYDEAIQDYTKVIQLNPKYLDAYNNRGRAKILLREYHGAIQDYSKAIELNPKYAISYNNRGNAKRLMGEYDEAIQDYSKAIQLSPKYAEAYYNIGIAMYELNRLNLACLDWSIAGELGYKDAYEMIRKHCN